MRFVLVAFMVFLAGSAGAEQNGLDCLRSHVPLEITGVEEFRVGNDRVFLLAVDLRNGLTRPIARIGIRATLRAPGRETPWGSADMEIGAYPEVKPGESFRFEAAVTGPWDAMTMPITDLDFAVSLVNAAEDGETRLFQAWLDGRPLSRMPCP